jgi:hypothetical protein
VWMLCTVLLKVAPFRKGSRKEKVPNKLQTDETVYNKMRNLFLFSVCLSVVE